MIESESVSRAWPRATALGVATVFLVAVAGCGVGGTKTTQVFSPATPQTGSPESVAPEPTPTTGEATTPATSPTGSAPGSPSPSPDAPDAPSSTAVATLDPAAEAFVATLPEDFEPRLAEELEALAEIAREWNPSAEISMAIVLPDESIYGINAHVSQISASAVKPLWTAAAIHAAGLEAVRPLAGQVLALSDNLAGGEMIDLAGGVDSVNAWTWEVAGLLDTRLEAWRFNGPDRTAADFRPEAPAGNRTTAVDLAHFFARLHRGELLGPDETSALEGWLRDTSRSLAFPRDVDGALPDRLPSTVATSAVHKSGWLLPGCCPRDYRQVVDAGLVELPDGGWFAVAILTAHGEHFDLSLQWVALASCRIYAQISGDAGIICERDQDGIHNPELWPKT